MTLHDKQWNAKMINIKDLQEYIDNKYSRNIIIVTEHEGNIILTVPLIGLFVRMQENMPHQTTIELLIDQIRIQILKFLNNNLPNIISIDKFGEVFKDDSNKEECLRQIDMHRNLNYLLGIDDIQVTN